MKKIGLFLAGLLFLPACAWAQDMASADKTFEEGNFAQAKKEYQQLLAAPAEPDRLKAQLRVVACEYYLGEYLNAAKTVYGYELPADPLWKARFLLYRVQTAERVKNTYRPVLEESELASESEPEDLSLLTAGQWQAKIDREYEALWSLREKLINAPVEKETLILNVKDTDVRRLPTLFDVVVNEWKKVLATRSAAVLLRAEKIISADFQPSPNPQSNMEKWASVLTEAARLDGKNRQDAKIFWQTERLLLPLEYPENFETENASALRAQVAERLQQLSGYKTVKPGFWERLKGAVQPAAHTDYAKAYAAWRGARLQNEAEDFEEAAAWCDWTVRQLQASYFTQACADLAEEIRRPQLSLKDVPGNQNPEDLTVTARTRNISRIYVRIYKTSFDELKKLASEGRRGRYAPTENSWNYLHQLSQKSLTAFVSRPPFKTFTGAVTYDKPHAYKNLTLSLPALDKGFYVVAVADSEDFSAQTAPVAGAVLNVTDLTLFVTSAIVGDPADYRVTPQTKKHTFHPEVFRVYSVNLKTGNPVAGADVTMFTDWDGSQEKGRTDENGLLALSRTIQVGADEHNSYLIKPLAQKEGEYAIGADSSYFHFYPNDPVQLFVETDRAIYRAGQTVKYSVNAFAAAARGMTVLPGARLQITARDANYDKFYTQTLTANAMGTVSGEFTLPEGRLLGRYRLEAALTSNGKRYSVSFWFNVDDYKRPDYKLTLQDAQKPFEYGKTAQVQGTAAYYFGAPLQKTEVSYKVTRQELRLPCWWWMPSYYEKSEVVADGSVKTDDKGNFKIEFTPSVPANGRPEMYVVTASVMDQSGRAIDAKNTYKASVKAHFFALTFTQGFYDENKAASLASLRLIDVNGADAEGKVRVEISRLENTHSTAAGDADKGTDFVVSGEPFSLDGWFGKNKVTAQIVTRDYEFKKSGEQTISVPALPEGVYKLTLKNNKADTQEFVFLVAAAQSALDLPAVAIAQHATYYPGSDARLLIGAARLNGPKWVEVYQGAFLLKRETLPARVSIYTLPVTETDRGNVYVRWFGASDYKLYHEQAAITVPYDNKKLEVSFQGPETVKPGQKAVWRLSAKDAAGAPVQGQASVTVYDQSLDYYAAKEFPLSLNQLFPSVGLNAGFEDGSYRSSGVSFYTPQTRPEPVFKSLPLPGVNLTPRLYAFSAARSLGGAVRNLAMAKQAMPLAAEDEMVAESLAFGADSGAAVTADADMYSAGKLERAEAPSAAATGAQEPPADVRTDFSETAYYNPVLPVTGGQATVTVPMPQSLTAWKFMGFVLTKDARLGSFTASAVTRKDFMVRLALPRFYREGDQSRLKALVTNLTKKKQTVQVEVTVKKDGEDAAAAFGIAKTVKTVTVPAGSTAEASWDITVPDGAGVLSVTAVARAGAESDGEQKLLPLLPSRERLLATANAALKDGSNTLTLSELSSDKTVQAETAVLQINPSLILTVLNSMPSLQNSPYKDLLTRLNKYVPLAVVNKFYLAYPQLRQAVANLPKRSTARPAWQSDDSLRLTLLEQTPWLQASRGGETENLISLFDPALVGKEKAAALKDILSYQNADGSFAWLPGGRADAYLTLYTLAAFGEAYRFGAEVPQSNIRKAVAWVTDEINRKLKNDPEGSLSSVSYALYAAHTLSVYPQTWQEVKAARPHIQAWVDWADKQSKFMTPLGRAYAAAVYHRLGDADKAQHYLTVLLAQMKTNELTGAYFAPEAQSWVWYNDTMATQTATLKTLLEVRPDAPEVDAMVQWILFNRQATEWDSPRATAQAVYCLLDVMQKKGLMNQSSSYRIAWGGLKSAKTLQPFDWTNDLRWEKQGASVTPADYTAVVEKQGGLTDFASLSVVYSSKDPKASPKGVLNVKREYYVKFLQDGVSKIRPVEDLTAVKTGDEVEVHLTLTSDSAFDYVLLADPRPSGFESKDLLSGWNWNPVPVYQENRDAATYFYIYTLPAGEVKLKYVMRPTLAGEYRAMPAQVQSMYAPQFGAHTAGFKLSVE